MAFYDTYNESRRVKLAEAAQAQQALQAFANFMQKNKENQMQSKVWDAQAQNQLASAAAQNQANQLGQMRIDQFLKQQQQQSFPQGMIPGPNGWQPAPIAQQQSSLQPIQKEDLLGNITPQYQQYERQKEQARIDSIAKRQRDLIDYQRNNPSVNQDTQGAVAAYEFAVPRLQRVKDYLSNVSDSDFRNLVKQVQIGANNDLIVPDGSPLEDVVGAINDIRLTGFGLGGKNFTENEAKIVFGRLDPTGKSKSRWVKDINSLPDFFRTKAKAGMGGRKNATDVMSESNPLVNSSATSFSDKDKESRYQAWKAQQTGGKQ